MRNLFWIITCLGTGLVGFYFGFFYTGTVCDGNSGACHTKAAFTPEPVVLIVGGVFFLFGLWLLYRTFRKPNLG